MRFFGAAQHFPAVDALRLLGRRLVWPVREVFRLLLLLAFLAASTGVVFLPYAVNT